MAAKPDIIARIEEITAAITKRRVYHDCYFGFVNSTEARLVRSEGYLLTIDDVPEEVPTDGVALAPTGSTAGTFYYVYAYMSSGVMTLMYSTTVPVLDSRNGMRVMTGDATKTLVGAFRPAAGPIFKDDSASGTGTGTVIGVLSHYNRKLKCLTTADTADSSTNSTLYTTPANSPQAGFLAWGDVVTELESMAGLNPAGLNFYMKVALDGTDVGYEVNTWNGDGVLGYAASKYNALLTAGYHTADTKFKVSTGTALLKAGQKKIKVWG